jgi:hypothetical protein
MLPGPTGYVPEPFYLTETLRSQQRFHDPLGDSLFSHSRSVEGYREWSGRNTPINSPKAAATVFPLSAGQETPPSESSSPTPPGPPTLLVRSSRPLTVPPRSGLTPGAMTKADDDIMPKCKKIHDNLYEIQLPSLVTPASPAPGGNLKRIRYAVLEVSRVCSAVPSHTIQIQNEHSGTPSSIAAMWTSKVTILACSPRDDSLTHSLHFTASQIGSESPRKSNSITKTLMHSSSFMAPIPWHIVPLPSAFSSRI